MHHLRFAFRRLRQSPGFTAVALLTLAFGIGANTAMFSLVNTLLLQPAPYPEAQQLVRVYRTAAQSSQLPQSLPDFRDERGGAQSFASLTAYQGWAYSLAEPGQPAEHLFGVTATADLFATLGVQPALGRGFTADEQIPGRDGVAVLSYECWRRRFAGRPEIVGQTIRLDGENVTVVGVMPESAAYPLFWGGVEIWRPLRLTNDWREQRGVYWLNVIGRLRTGASLDTAGAELAGIAARLGREYPATNAGSSLRLIRLHESALADTSQRLTWLTFGLAGFVLLIACANLANLQLARTAAAARTTAVRIALGAPQVELIGGAIAESLLLAAAGGALGIALAATLGRLMTSQISSGSGPLTFALAPGVILFALLITLAAGVISGVVPAWAISHARVNDVLKQQSRGSTGDRAQHRFRHALVVIEIALTLVLLSGAGLFLRGLQRFAHRELGWHTAGLLTGTITLPENRYPTVEGRRAFHDRLLRRVSQLPGVESAALASAVPIAAADNAPLPVFVEGRPAAVAGREPLAQYSVVSPGFFHTLQLSLLMGRLPPADWRPGSPPAVVINETTARTLWPGENPIGRRLSSARDGGTWEEVIGVVRDVGFAADLSAPATRMQVYRSLPADPWAFTTVVVRATAPAALADSLRRAVAELDTDLPVDRLRTIEQAVDESQHYFRVANGVLAGFAGLGLLLSAVGLYGVVAALVARRTQEFGIRFALGAQVSDVLGLVIGTGLRLALTGVAAGMAGSFALARFIGAMAPQMPAQDPAVIASVSVLLVAIALLACWVPARRAAKVDPITALRAE